MKRNFIKFIAFTVLFTTVMTACNKTLPVTGVTLNKSSLSLKIGDKETLMATVQPSDATDQGVIWTSSNPNVATATGGNVIAKAIGTTTITVTTVDGNFNATCTVTVTETGEPNPSKIYKIGDYYDVNGLKGVVFRVSADGKSGNILAMEYYLGKICWCSRDNDNTNAKDTVNGENNLRAIRGFPFWKERYVAFNYVVDNHGEGWYLPVPSEIKDILNNITKINATLKSQGKSEIVTKVEVIVPQSGMEIVDVIFWSSVEHDISRAFALDVTSSGIATRNIAKSSGSGQEETPNYAAFAVKKF